MQQLFRKIFTPLGVIVLDRPARATPGPHPMGGGQLPDSVGCQLNKPKKQTNYYLEEKDNWPPPHWVGVSFPIVRVMESPQITIILIYLEEWNCPKSYQDKTFQNVDLSYRSLLPHRV